MLLTRRFGAIRRLDAAAEMQRMLMVQQSVSAECDANIRAAVLGPSDEECQRARDELVAALAALEAAR